MPVDERPENKVAEAYCRRRGIALAVASVLYSLIFIATLAEFFFMTAIQVNVKKLDEMYPGMGALLWQNKLSGTDAKVLEAAKPPKWYTDCREYSTTNDGCIHKVSLSHVTSNGKKLRFVKNGATDASEITLKHYSIFAYYKTSKNYLDTITSSYKKVDPVGKCTIGKKLDTQMACGNKDLNSTMRFPPNSCESCWNLQKDQKIDLDLCAHFFAGRRSQVVGFLIFQAFLILVCLVFWRLCWLLYDKKGWKPKASTAIVGSNPYRKVPEQQTYGTMGRSEAHPFLDFYHPAVFIYGAFVFGFSMRVWELVPVSKDYYDCAKTDVFVDIEGLSIFFPVTHVFLGFGIGVVWPIIELGRVYWKITRAEQQVENQDNNQDKTNQTQQSTNQEQSGKGDNGHMPGETSYMAFRV